MIYTRDFKLYVKAEDMDITAGVRRGSVEHPSALEPKVPLFKRIYTALF